MEQGNWLMNELEAEKSLAQTKEEKEFISKLQVRLEKRLTKDSLNEVYSKPKQLNVIELEGR